MAELKVKVSADTRGFTQGMNFSKQEVQNWNRVMQKASDDSSRQMTERFTLGFGAVSAAALAAGKVVHDALDFGGKMQDMGDRTGIDPEVLQRFGLEASLAGSNVEKVVSVMEKLAANSQEALGGNAEMADVFERMGFTMDDLANASIEQIFEKVREHMRNTKLDAETMADYLKIAGKGSGELIPMLRNGEAGGSAFNSSEEVLKLDEIGDQLDVWKAEAAAVGRSMVASVGSAIMDFVTFGEHSKKVRQGMRGAEEERGVISKANARAEAEEKEKQAKIEKQQQKEAEAHAKKIAALQEQVNKSVRDYQFSRLKTDEERIAFLEKEKEAMVEVMSDLSPENEESRLKAMADVNNTQKEIDDIKKRKEEKEKSPLAKWEDFTTPKDSLVKAGNFLGQNTGQNRSEDYLRSIVDYTRKVADNTKPSMTGSPYRP